MLTMDRLEETGKALTPQVQNIELVQTALHALDGVEFKVADAIIGDLSASRVSTWGLTRELEEVGYRRWPRYHDESMNGDHTNSGN